MRIYSFCCTDYDCLVQKLSIAEESSLVIVSFDLGGHIDLFEELGKEGGKMRVFSDISRNRKLRLFIGFYVAVGEKNYLSVLVVNKGKLVGMSDMTHCLSDMYDIGAKYKTYDIDDCVIGVIVGEDMYFSEVYRTLCLNNAELLLAIHNKPMRDIDESVVAANAYMNGTSIIAQMSDGVIYCVGERHCCAVEKNDFMLDMQITINNRFLAALKDSYDDVEEL